MPNLVWSKSMEREHPGFFLGSDRILFHYTAERRHTLVCFDFAGNELWQRSGFTAYLPLPDNRFLVTSEVGQLLLLDGAGTVVRRGVGGFESVVRHGEHLVFVGGHQVTGTDDMLNPLWRLTWPSESQPTVDCFTGRRFYWMAADELKFCDLDGQVGTLSCLPNDLIAGAKEQCWQEMARPISDEYKNLPFQWNVSFDPRCNRFFVANSMPPHLVLSLSASRRTQWCKCLGTSCCGGVPYPLPDGRYIVSSGCGGVVSWLDGDGNILFQSRPHEGRGLATALSNEVKVLPDGRALVSGGPGLVAYNTSGERLWVFPPGFMHFDCDSNKGIIVRSYWSNNEPGARNQMTLEFANGL